MRNQLMFVINEFEVLEILFCFFMCLYMARECGSRIDKENRQSAGKPVFISIPDKWRWLFCNKVNSYAGRTKILRVSFVIHLLGYLSASIELLFLLMYLYYGTEEFVTFSFRVWLLCGLLVSGISLVSSYIYESNLQRAYDYDWITYWQEGIQSFSKRKCRVIDKKDDGIYVITIGVCKHRHLAISEFSVGINENLYAIHIYNEDGPCWELRKY